MALHGTDIEKALAKDFKRALTGGRLDFTVVKARVNGSGSVAEYGGYNEKHFDMSL